jgi:putative redox protein
MVETTVVYEGDLHCRAKHGPSGAEMVTDAPLDNQGKGEAFSPTDLLGTAIGTCVLTIMGIYARRHSLALEGARAVVLKEMVTLPVRRIGKLTVAMTLPASIPAEHRKALEACAASCPVSASLRDDVEKVFTYTYA